MQTSTMLQGAVAEDLGISNLSEEAQNRVITALGENVLKSVVLKLFAMLSPEDRKAADEISKMGDTDVLLEYFKTKIPNVDEVVGEETRAVVAEFKQLRDQAK